MDAASAPMCLLNFKGADLWSRCRRSKVSAKSIKPGSSAKNRNSNKPLNSGDFSELKPKKLSSELRPPQSDKQRL